MHTALCRSPPIARLTGAPCVTGKGSPGKGKGGFGGRGFGGKGGGKGRPEEGPPDSVLPIGEFMHPCEGDLIVKSTNEKIPYFNAPIYLENITQVGKVGAPACRAARPPRPRLTSVPAASGTGR